MIHATSVNFKDVMHSKIILLFNTRNPNSKKFWLVYADSSRASSENSCSQIGFILFRAFENPEDFNPLILHSIGFYNHKFRKDARNTLAAETTKAGDGFNLPDLCELIYALKIS